MSPIIHQPHDCETPTPQPVARPMAQGTLWQCEVCGAIHEAEDARKGLWVQIADPRREHRIAEVERLRAQRTVTEDMVERAARTFYEYPMMRLDASLRTNWDRLTTISPDVADNHRAHAAAALAAALTPDESS